MIFPGFPGVPSFSQVFQVEWEPWSYSRTCFMADYFQNWNLKLKWQEQIQRTDFLHIVVLYNRKLAMRTLSFSHKWDWAIHRRKLQWVSTCKHVFRRTLFPPHPNKWLMMTHNDQSWLLRCCHTHHKLNQTNPGDCGCTHPWSNHLFIIVHTKRCTCMTTWESCEI